jgi:hypothetical protein
MVEHGIARGYARAVLILVIAFLAAGCAANEPSRLGSEPFDVESGATLETMPAVLAEKPGDVALRFAWPAPSGARCAVIARRIEPAGTQTVHGTYALRVEDDGDQVRITSYDAELMPGAPSMAALAEAWNAERLVDAYGGLLRVRPLDAQMSDAERALVTSRLTQRWQAIVGAWATRSLPLGVTYSATAPEQTASGPIRLQLAIRVDGHVPCERGAKTARCVRLRIMSQPTPADAPAAARLAARELLPADELALFEPNRVKAFAAQTTVVLVTEADTLVPHRMSERRMLRLRIDPLIGDRGADVDRQDEVTHACTWGAGAR